MKNIQPKYEYIAGNVERITYHNQDNGFAVLRVKVKGRKDLVSVTGTLPNISVGEDIKAQGGWHNQALIRFMWGCKSCLKPVLLRLL